MSSAESAMNENKSSSVVSSPAMPFGSATERSTKSDTGVTSNSVRASVTTQLARSNMPSTKPRRTPSTVWTVRKARISRSIRTAIGIFKKSITQCDTLRLRAYNDVDMTVTQRWLQRLTPIAAAPELDWEQVYAEELPRIYNFFRYRVGDGMLAEDLTAATFEKAWRARQRYRRNRAAFSTWLFTIARNVATDYYRRRQPLVSWETLHGVAGGE